MSVSTGIIFLRSNTGISSLNTILTSNSQIINYTQFLSANGQIPTACPQSPGQTTDGGVTRPARPALGHTHTLKRDVSQATRPAGLRATVTLCTFRGEGRGEKRATALNSMPLGSHTGAMRTQGDHGTSGTLPRERTKRTAPQKSVRMLASREGLRPAHGPPQPPTAEATG